MNLPMREKYVDEAVGIWLVLDSVQVGKTYITSVGLPLDRDIFPTPIPKDRAEKVVILQEEFRQNLYKLLCTGD